MVIMVEQKPDLDFRANSFVEVLKLHLAHAAITIHETSLNAPPTSTRSSDPFNQLQRVDDLWTCFSATKSWINTFFSPEIFPPSCYPDISMALFTQLAHCLVILCRLNTFESSDIPWDCQRIRQEMDVGELLRLWAETWDSVPEAAGLILDSDKNDISPWLYTKQKLQPIAKWWEMRLAAEKEKVHVATDDVGIGLDAVPQLHLGAIDFPVWTNDFMEGAWGSDIFGQGAELFGAHQF
jgi:hypothetical protein